MARPRFAFRPSRASIALATTLISGILCACDGVDDPDPYAQGDMAGTWDFATLRVGAEQGWERGTVSVTGAGAVTLLSYLDDLGNTDPGAQDPVVVAVDPATGDLSQRVNGVPVPFHGTLARDRNLFAAVSTPQSGAYSLMLARRRGAASYSSADLRGRTFALHALQVGGAGEWRYGTGSVDSQGVVALGDVMGPPLIPGIAPPAPNGATLGVDADGFVSDGGSFRGFLTPDKSALVAVHPDTLAPGSTQQLTILVFTGRVFTQPDLAGVWGANALAGNVSPIWFHATLEVGATGAGRYLPPFLDGTGGTTLPPNVAFTLAPDGTMTQGAQNPSYRGTLASNGELYVRTQTHNPPGRYGLGVALRR